MAAQPSVRVAISDDFLDAFADIPRSQQSKVRRFVEMFRANPTAPGINYEKITDARDPKLRSVRVDQAYRGIVLKPDSGDVYMLLWVAHHDNAYDWARNKVYSIHPETGGLQVIDTEQIDQLPKANTAGRTEGAERRTPDLFAAHRDREIISIGVPAELMPLVRSVKTEADLDRIERYLPQEAFEALFYLATGASLEEVDRELAALRKARDGEVDTEDYEAALEHPDTKRRFRVVDDEIELSEILNAPLEKWRVFLHPSQEQMVRMNAKGPVRVLGGAGTGKTVVAMHRARYLVEKVFEGKDERLLFTTFTRNLAADITENLAKICPEETLARIEVVNLDRWVAEFLQRHGHDFDVAFQKRLGPIWEQAMLAAPQDAVLPDEFYREEWEQVVQPHEVTSLAEYMRIARTGRGTRLSRGQRKDVWPVFEEYQALMNEKRLREPDGAMRDARLLLERKGAILPYRSIVVDEAQDLGRQAFLLLRAMVPERSHDLFIVGDAHQRIYRQPVVLGQCGIEIRGRSRKLRINYRTTEENRRWAVRLLEGVPFDDLDGGTDDQEGYRSLLHGVEPEVISFGTFAEETAYLVSYLESLTDEELRRTCLVARTNQLVDQYAGVLRSRGVPTYRVQRSTAEDRSAPGVRLATMHRVKGLEFDRVLIVSVNDNIIPLDRALAAASDELERESSETRERSLLYVAATRAKREVKVTSWGVTSPFLSPDPG